MLKKWVVLPVMAIVIRAGGQFSASTIADSLYLLGNYTVAINEYAKVGTEGANLQIARAYHALGNYEKAILQYQAVLKHNPDKTIARFELGKLLLKTKQLPEAYDALALLIEKKTGNPEYHYYLGRVKEHSGDIRAANASFRNAVHRDSTHLKSLFSLSKFYVGIQQKDSALLYINAGLRFYENDVALINLKALAYFNDGQYEKAIPFFEKLIQLGEEKPFLHEKLGYSYFRNWQFDKAKEQYHELRGYPDKLATAFNGLAEVFMEQEQLDSAEYYINKYIKERSIDFSTEYANLGRIARLREHTKKAMDFYYKAWEENTENPWFYYQFCTLADEFYKDPKQKLTVYQKFVRLYANRIPYLQERAEKRIAELKEEIHFSKD